MAITNMNDLFDKLQEYIDKKIENLEEGFKDLFEEYGLKEILPYLDEIRTVSDNLAIIQPVGANINAVVNVHNNMDTILATPGYVDDIKQGVEDAEIIFDKTALEADKAFKWAQEEFEVPVDDGNHTGYSSYHWSLVAEQSAYQLTLKGKWSPTSMAYPSPDAHGDYWFVEKTGEFDGDLWYAGDALIWKDDTDGQEWIHKRESVHWLQIVGKPSMYTPKPHYHSEYVQNDNLIANSPGPQVAGYPIKLWSDGRIHNSMIKLPVTYIVDWFTPIPTSEYPDTVNYDVGASWLIVGVHPNDGYTFFTGELIGRTIRNGDFMILAQEGWIIQYDKLNVEEYLKRNGLYAMFGSLKMGLNQIVDVAEGTEDNHAATVSQLQTVSDNVFSKDEYLVVSSGIADQGKPIILNEYGLIDSTMIAFNTLTIMGDWNPSDGTEYPPTDGLEPGASWRIDGVPDAGYEYITGDLQGKTAFNGDWIILGQSGWFLTAINIVPEDYYRIDGTTPLIADFNAGGHRISQIADGVVDTDATSYSQVINWLQGKSDYGHTHTPTSIQPQGSGSGLDADLLDGYNSTDFIMVGANINPGQIQPQGADSGLDADMLDGKHSSEFFSDINPVDWTDIENKPTGFQPIKASQYDVGGIRIWADGDILNIATDDYVAP